jgi:biopolymer transport protein ExbD
MAISINGGGSNGGGRRRRQGAGALAEINVTPFVDVVLVLLIIFMMTAHAMEYGIEIEVPKTKGQVEKSAQDLPIIQITHDGRFFLNDQPVSNIHNLGATIRQRYPNPKAVYLKADKDTIWDVCVQVMAELGDAKLPVNIVTQPADEPRRRR